MEESAGAGAVRGQNVAAVIPAYQEEKHVGDVVKRTLAQIDHVLVVDDGSTDETGYSVFFTTRP